MWYGKDIKAEVLLEDVFRETQKRIFNVDEDGAIREVKGSLEI